MSTTFQYSGVTYPLLGSDPVAPREKLWKPLATLRQWEAITHILSIKWSIKAQDDWSRHISIRRGLSGGLSMQLHKGLFLNQRVSKQSSIVRVLKSSCLEKQTCDEKGWYYAVLKWTHRLLQFGPSEWSPEEHLMLGCEATCHTTHCFCN